MIEQWSCGGGVQSAAIAVLIIQGRLPKPDISVIVDTEREKATTWDYYDSVLKPELAAIGVDLVRVPKSRYRARDLFCNDGTPRIPAFIKPDGHLTGFCSNEWKKRVVMRYLRDLGVKSCRNWIGISTDELGRVRAPDNKWFQPRYPLIFDIPKSRAACIELVRLHGWPKPPRSSCWMCPHHSDQEWRAMTRDEIAKAAELEREMQLRYPDYFLHKSCEPIDTVVFDGPESQNLDGCQTGFCFT